MPPTKKRNVLHRAARALARRAPRPVKRVYLKAYRRTRGIFGPTKNQIGLAAVLIFDETRENAKKVTAREREKFVKDRGKEPTRKELRDRTAEEIYLFREKIFLKYVKKLVVGSVSDTLGAKRNKPIGWLKQVLGVKIINRKFALTVTRLAKALEQVEQLLS
ncbi:MAG: hypothetical protein HY392_02300 [Candidatus Diapherotrites archaeon]|nr:hypothetical protein [Candidatus Diapherotrites archaeon]